MSGTASRTSTTTPPPGGTDRTAQTRSWLRARRGAGRARRAEYAAYVVVVLLLGWYGLFAIGLFQELGHRSPLAEHAEAIARVMPRHAVVRRRPPHQHHRPAPAPVRPLPRVPPPAAAPWAGLAACWLLAALLLRWVVGRARRRIRP
ncbi:hypothetical protein [Streptomyces sp. B93]|uniref:hypothetical protein n=1 Tax=Streptomyces sp. B93 TaxID=2824875 RepID=UPI001B364C61|nr:hypothetical protein [Streptomyces sp. B93]MBQ1092527.1 hypothetical protein [Streptomyces sp. B93]